METNKHTETEKQDEQTGMRDEYNEQECDNAAEEALGPVSPAEDDEEERVLSGATYAQAIILRTETGLSVRALIEMFERALHPPPEIERPRGHLRIMNPDADTQDDCLEQPPERPQFQELRLFQPADPDIPIIRSMSESPMVPSGIHRTQLELSIASEYPGVGSNRRRASSISMPAGTSRAEVVEFLPRITELTASLTNHEENTISRTRFSLDDDDEEYEAPLLSRESAIYDDTDSDTSEENEFTSLRLVRSPCTINLRRLLRTPSPPVPEPSDLAIEPIHQLIPSNQLPRRHTSDSVPGDSPLRMPLRRILGEQLLHRRFASLGRHRTQESFLYGEVQRRRQQVVFIPTSTPTGWEVRLVDGVGELGPEDAIGSLLSRYRDVDPAEIEEDIGPLMMDGQGDDDTPFSGSEEEFEESEEEDDDDYEDNDPQDGAPPYNDPLWEVDHPVYHDDDHDE